jgi:AcrR family transcriptional regulator
MDDPAEDIMGATFRALCDHGYAELTMRDIAEESDRSKAALHYHYDDKEGLMLAFLDHLYERFHDRVGGYATGEADRIDDADGSGAPNAIDDPDAQLRAFVAAVLSPPHADDRREFRTALLEIKAQAPYQPAFQERIARFDALVTETVTDLVEAGQAAGVYRESVDPAHVAQFVLVTLDGAGARHVIADEPVECALASLSDYFDGHLLVDGAEPGAADHAAECSMEPARERADGANPTEAGGE